MLRFSLVAEIGWLASEKTKNFKGLPVMFQSRCRDWVVGETGGEKGAEGARGVSVSLPRLGGWRALYFLHHFIELLRFSLVAEIGWLASIILDFP